MQELSVPIGDPAAASRPRGLSFCSRKLIRRKHLQGLLLLGGLLLVVYPPLVRIVGWPNAVGDYFPIVTGAGVLLILLVLGAHLLTEYSRLVRLSESQQLSAVDHDRLTGDPRG
jgi:hypothetical protein